MHDHLSDLGREIGTTLERVLNSRDLEELRHNVDAALRRTAEQVNRPGGPTQTPQDVPHDMPPGYTPPRRIAMPQQATATAMALGGTAIAVVAGFVVLAILAIGLGALALPALALPALVLPLAICAGGIWLAAKGFGRRARVRRLAQYQRIWQKKSYCAVADLAAGAGRSTAFVLRDLKRMLRDHLLSEGYFDAAESTLMLDSTTYQTYLQTQQQAKQLQREEQRQKELYAKDPEQAALHETLAEGHNTLRRIREANSALPGEVISCLLDDLAQVADRIFEHVRQQPRKLPQIRKLMCYYLPATLKLVETYQQMEKSGHSTPEEQATRREIEGALRNINSAFENLLSELLRDNLMDVSADISVLESMLAQEGLIQDPIHRRSQKKEV